MTKLFIFFLLSLIPLFSLAQSPLISIDVKNEKIDKALLDLAASYQYDIFFHESYFEETEPITLNLQNASLEKVLQSILKNTQVDFEINDKEIILKKLRTIYGYVRDDTDHEGLVNVAVYQKELMQGTYTNEYGYFSLTLPFESQELTIRYLGYKMQTISLGKENDAITIFLKPFFIENSEVVVLSNYKQPSELPQNMDGENIIPAEIGGCLSTGGEPDINQHLYKQSGVSSGPDGFGGLHVRGGNSNQNLILLDGVRIFHANHAFGLFSIFNTALLKNAKFSKYNFNPKYSRGTSSIVNMTLKEGSTKKWNGNASVSTIASQATINGPIIKNKTSILLSFRRSHLDKVINRVSARNKEDNMKVGFSDFSFYDMNAKLHHVLGKKDKLYLSYYRGSDDFKDEGESFEIRPTSFGLLPSLRKENQKVSWENEMTALKWNHLFKNNLFSSAILSYSQFEFRSDARINDELDFEFFSTKLTANVNLFQESVSRNREFGFRYDLEHYPKEGVHNSVGINYHRTNFLPGKYTGGNNITIKSFIEPNTVDTFLNLFQDEFFFNKFEHHHVSLYGNRKMKFSKLLELNLGGKLGWLKTYNESYSKTTSDYENLSSQFLIWNARAALAFHWNKKWNMLLSATKSDQGIHQFSSENIGFPNDFWIPAHGKAKPQTTWQTNLFVQYQPSNPLRISSSIFYKKMSNLIRFMKIDAYVDLGIENQEFRDTLLWFGSGKSIGMELDLNYKTEKMEFDLSYTLSKYDRQFDSIDNKMVFPFEFDQLHNLAVSGKYNFNSSISCYAHFMFNNGVRQTFKSVSYDINPIGIFNSEYDEQLSGTNADRLPAYHRLDIGVVFNFGKKWKHNVALGVQNVLNRRNIYNRYRLNIRNGNYEIVGFEDKEFKSLPILPLLRYSVNF